MALKIAKNSALTDIVSTDGTNPLTTQHPIAGSTVEVQCWLYNDENTRYYTGINIDPTDTTGTDESTWVYLAPDNAGVAGTYGAASAPLTMANIGSAGTPDVTGHPFWVKVVTPSVGSVQNKTDIKLTVNFTEFAV
jgi:hypothetical protein